MLFRSITILNEPSSYRETARSPGNPIREEIIDKLIGKKRAITVRFRYTEEVMQDVLNRLGKDAVLIDVDDYHFQTTIVDRASPDLLSWIAGFKCYAKIISPADVIERFLEWEKNRINDYTRLYEQDREPDAILTNEELDAMTDYVKVTPIDNEKALFPPEYTDEGEK